MGNGPSCKESSSHGGNVLSLHKLSLNRFSTRTNVALATLSVCLTFVCFAQAQESAPPPAAAAAATPELKPSPTLAMKNFEPSAD
jgi:hypothetical protein